MSRCNPTEIVFLESAIRCSCYPRGGDALLPEDRFTGASALAKYNAQFNVWCGMKDGILAVRDARDAEVGANAAMRNHLSPVQKWETLHSILIPQSFPTFIIAAKAGLREVWVSYSDGPIRVFSELPPYAMIAELGTESNKRAATHLAASADGRFVVASCGDDHATVFDAKAKVEVVRLLGHTGAVRASVFLGAAGRLIATCSGDGSLCVWDTATVVPGPNAAADPVPSAPVIRVTLSHGLPITTMAAVPVTGDEVRMTASTYTNCNLFTEDLISRFPNDNWLQLWCGSETGDIFVFVVPIPHDVSETSFVGYFEQPAKRLHRTHAVHFLTVAIGTAETSSKIVMGTTAKSAKVFRYNPVTFETLPALSASTTDGDICASAGAYPPTAISAATVMPVWAIMANGTFKQLTLEQAGTGGSDADQRTASVQQLTYLRNEHARLASILAKHKDLLTHIDDPAKNPDLASAQLDTADLHRRLAHMRRVAVGQVLAHQVGNGLRVRYFRKLVLWHAHRKHNSLRNQAMRLLYSNETTVRRGYFDQWTVGAAVMKLRRIRNEAAVSLVRIISRSRVAHRFAAWRVFQGQRNATKRLTHLLTSTALRLRTRYMDTWVARGRKSLALKAKASLLNCLQRQVFRGLRSAYFSKWLQAKSVIGISNSLRRTAASCVGTIAASNERTFLRLYFRRWMKYPPIAAHNRAKLRAAQFLVSSSDSLLRKRIVIKWRQWARLKAARRSSAGANSTLARLTESGTRMAYFRRWKSVVNVKRAKEQRSATAEGAIGFITSRSNRALQERYYKLWTSFATDQGAKRRQRASLDIFLRQTRLGRVIQAYHLWRKVAQQRRRRSQKDRTAQLLIRSSTLGLSRACFTVWQRFPAERRRARRRGAVLGTFERQSSARLLHIYFRKWSTMHSLVKHLDEVALYMANCGKQRVGRLRSVYFSKWISFVAIRCLARKRSMVAAARARSEKLQATEARLAALKDEINAAKSNMTQLLEESAVAAQLAEALDSEATENAIREAEIKRKLELQLSELSRATEHVSRCAYTLKTPRSHPVAIAAGWKNEWLALAARIDEVTRHAAVGPVPYFDYVRTIQEMRETLVSMRNGISCDVAADLVLKNVPPPSSSTATPRLRTPSSSPMRRGLSRASSAPKK